MEGEVEKMPKWVVEALSETGSPDGGPVEVTANGSVQAAKKVLKENLVTVCGPGGRLRAKVYMQGEPGTAPEIVYLYKPR
jgi:hypothetical protein